MSAGARNIIVSTPLVDGRAFQNPYWIFVTVPYTYLDTVDRSKIGTGANGGFRIVTSDESKNQASDARQPMLFSPEIISWSLSQDKNNHIGSLNMEMINPDNNLATLIWVSPGDWCMFWAFNDRKTYNKVRARLIGAHNAMAWTPNPNEPKGDRNPDVNFYASGLKFVGRVKSVRHHESKNPGSGESQSGYSLQAQAFTELDTTIYYNSLIAFKYSDNALQFIPDFGVSLRNFLVFAPADNRGFVNTNTFLPAYIKIALGKGPGELSKARDETQAQTGPSSKIRSSPNVQYEVPDSVLKLLGQTDRKYFADILLQFIGVQSFDQAPSSEPHSQFLPEISDTSDDGTLHYAKKGLVDYYPPDPLMFKDRSVWDCIQAYLNRPINEVFTALKPDPLTGRLLPSITIRRTPYSSEEYANNKTDSRLDATDFAAMPRWVIPTSLVYELDIGRSDIFRYNYVHVTPTVYASRDAATQERIGYIFSPPLVDEASIKRHGLRLLNIRVAGFGAPSAQNKDNNTQGQYTSFVADQSFDAHLRLSGSMTCVGIQDNIQPGDNAVVNGAVYQIEGVVHQGSISGGTGQKSFTTSLQLSYGMPLKTTSEPRRKELESKRDEAQVRKSQAATPEDRTETDATIANIEDELKKVKAPSAEELRKLRNDRADLDEIGLVGTHTYYDNE